MFSLTKGDIIGQSRQQNIALARQITMWFYKYELDLSFPTIGKMFNGRDHTTVMHGCNKIKKLLDTDPKIQTKIQTVKDLLLHM
jgi:chromosomal replication initiator protein